ncbi:hypothetical protein SEVIR_9G189650v4 [Setaria viridis]
MGSLPYLFPWRGARPCAGEGGSRRSFCVGAGNNCVGWLAPCLRVGCGSRELVPVGWLVGLTRGCGASIERQICRIEGFEGVRGNLSKSRMRFVEAKRDCEMSAQVKACLRFVHAILFCEKRGWVWPCTYNIVGIVQDIGGRAPFGFVRCVIFDRWDKCSLPPGGWSRDAHVIIFSDHLDVSPRWSRTSVRWMLCRRPTIDEDA